MSNTLKALLAGTVLLAILAFAVYYMQSLPSAFMAILVTLVMPLECYILCLFPGEDLSHVW